MKSGKRIVIEEAEALRIAEKAQIPVPHVYSVEKHRMEKATFGWATSRVSRQPLNEAWPDMSADQKKDVCEQLRNILTTMRSIPPPDFIGSCDGGEIRDTRVYFTHKYPVCCDEQAFNKYLLSCLSDSAPPGVREAFANRLRTEHRVVLTHCDLSPRNIIVEDGRVKALIDWEDAGWYPEY